MKILIKSAEIIAPDSPYNKTVQNVLLDNGIIKSISSEISDADLTIEAQGLKLSIGWFDMRASIKDPGYEHKEDIRSVSRAASFGGFTALASLPNTSPTVQTKDVVSYIKSKASQELIDIFPMGAVTLNLKGEELTEMIDLHTEGAVAFTDGEKPIWHSDVLLKALQYLQKFDGLLISHAEDRYLSMGGQMNESKVSTQLGLKGLPKLSEELMIQRDLKILEYTGGRIHFPHISSPVSLELIKDARKKGLNVTCDIAAYQLTLNENELETFDTNLKVNPPLRSANDIKAFWKALDSGVIDVIVSDHLPQDTESKYLEFDLAEFGMEGLETLFSVINYHNKGLSIETFIEKIAYNPRKILNLEIPQIKEGEPANLTLFDTEKEWVFQQKYIKSKSKNNPFVGKKMKGFAKAVFNKNRYFLNEEIG